jgi:cytochrome c553
VIPSIAGMEKAKFIRLMTAFRDGTQPATLMNQLVRGLSDEQIDKLADYFASREASGGQGK